MQTSLVRRKPKENEIRERDRRRERLFRRFSMLLMALVLFSLFTVTACATGAGTGTGTGITEVDNMFGSLTSIIYGIARFAGVAVCLFGVIQIGMSISSHDASQRVQGFLVMAGGVIILFSPNIISAIAG